MSAVSSYKNIAEAFQVGKINSATEAGTAFSAAKGSLKGFYNDARDYKSFVDCTIQDPAAKAKTLKKFAEWERKEGAADGQGTYDIFYFMATLRKFAETFLASLKDPRVTEARLLKKVFKLETFKEFEKGTTVEQLQGQLKGLSDLTVGKVAYWHNTYQDLKKSGGLASKIESLEKKISE